MIQDRKAAEEISNRMLKINATLDEAVCFVQQRCSAEELEQFKLAVGEVMYVVFEKMLIPIYKEHRDLIPAGQRVSGITD